MSSQFCAQPSDYTPPTHTHTHTLTHTHSQAIHYDFPKINIMNQFPAPGDSDSKSSASDPPPPHPNTHAPLPHPIPYGTDQTCWQRWNPAFLACFYRPYLAVTHHHHPAINPTVLSSARQTPQAKASFSFNKMHQDHDSILRSSGLRG